MEELKQNANVVDGINNTTEDTYAQVLDSIQNGESNITVVELPQKGSPSEFDVKEWDKIYLTDPWVQKATKDGIKYPKEYFVISRITKDNNDKPVSVNIMGSMGGGYHEIAWNTPNLIKSKSGNALDS
jgi:hypothetical protein